MVLTDYIVHQNVTYVFADMTPILCFWAIIPLSSNKKSYILCKFGYTLNTGPPPIYISSNTGIYYSFHQNDTNILAEMTPMLCFWAIIPLSSKNKNESYILCKLGYALNSRAPPHIYRHKPVFTIVLTKTLHTFLLI